MLIVVVDAEADSGITGTSIFTAEDFNLSDCKNAIIHLIR